MNEFDKLFWALAVLLGSGGIAWLASSMPFADHTFIIMGFLLVVIVFVTFSKQSPLRS